jgi:hypothetical protein
MADPVIPPAFPPQPQTPSSGKWIIGCSAGCLSLIVIAVIGGCFAGFMWVKNYVAENSAPFIKEGYTKVSGQMIEVTNPVAKPTLYVGQMVRFHTDSNANVAIIAQTAEIQGKIQGKLSFRGQILVIAPGSDIAGDLDVQAQVVQNEGAVHGQTVGNFRLVKGNKLQLPPLKQ